MKIYTSVVFIVFILISFVAIAAFIKNPVQAKTAYFEFLKIKLFMMMSVFGGIIVSTVGVSFFLAIGLIETWIKNRR